MNQVILIGRLTRDPETRSANEMSYAKFTLAVDRRSKSETRQADFISCIAFGKTAESLSKYVHQGTKLAVCGRLQTGSYTKNDGTKVYTTDVVVNEWEFCESKSATREEPKPDVNGFLSVSADDENGLPFR